VAAFAGVVATAGFVLPGGAADLGTRVSGAALYTAWAAIGALPALLVVAVVGAGVRRGVAAYVRSSDEVS
jgi:hypothetical protein